MVFILSVLHAQSVLVSQLVGFIQKMRNQDSTATQSKLSRLELQVSTDLTVQVIPNIDHQFLLPSKDVALGYGVSPATLRKHMERNVDEFNESQHYTKGVTISHTLKGIQPHAIYWTKAGIIRLGFFIKSQKAKQFRDWAEKLILNSTEYRDVSKENPTLELLLRKCRTLDFNGALLYHLRDAQRLLGYSTRSSLSNVRRKFSTQLALINGISYISEEYAKLLVARSQARLVEQEVLQSEPVSLPMGFNQLTLGV